MLLTTAIRVPGGLRNLNFQLRARGPPAPQSPPRGPMGGVLSHPPAPLAPGDPAEGGVLPGHPQEGPLPPDGQPPVLGGGSGGGPWLGDRRDPCPPRSSLLLTAGPGWAGVQEVRAQTRPWGARGRPALTSWGRAQAGRGHQHLGLGGQEAVWTPHTWTSTHPTCRTPAAPPFREPQRLPSDRTEAVATGLGRGPMGWGRLGVQRQFPLPPQARATAQRQAHWSTRRGDGDLRPPVCPSPEAHGARLPLALRLVL